MTQVCIVIPSVQKRALGIIPKTVQVIIVEQIQGYTLTDKLTTTSAGTCRWGFCKKNGKVFFIKEFLSPVYPTSNAFSKEMTEHKKRICEEFYASRKSFYNVLSGCRNGNIVTVDDFFRSGSRYYIVTDRIENTASNINVTLRLNEQQKLTLLKTIAYSFSLLHDAGIVHADIKPDNILLKRTAEGNLTAKIIDFDSGFLIRNEPEEMAGDFPYLAPETFLKMNGKEVRITQKIDIFALGLLFHQYWTGTLPRINEQYNYTFEAVLDRSNVQLSNTLPNRVATVIQKMLALQPNQRPTAKEVFSMLSYDSKGAAIPGPKTPPPVKKGFYSAYNGNKS